MNYSAILTNIKDLDQYLLGQGLILQTSLWFLSPVQKSVPGSSISHSRDRQCRPSPHVVVQGLHDDHNE